MFRKLMLSTALALSTVTGLGLTAVSADAHPAAYRHRGGFEVMYRCGNHWDCYGTFPNRDAARRVAHQLRHRGYVVQIEPTRGW